MEAMPNFKSNYYGIFILQKTYFSWLLSFSV